MKQISPLRAQLAIPPLSLYFVSITVLFSSLSWLAHHYLDSDIMYSPLQALLAGSLFGGVMVLAVAITRRRLQHALGTTLTPEQQLEMNWAVTKTTLPQDTYLRQLYPRYVNHFIRINRHSRIYIILVFAVMTALGAWLANSQHATIWYVYDVLFVLLGSIGVIGANRYLHHLRVLQTKLSTTPYHQQFLSNTSQSVRA